MKDVIVSQIDKIAIEVKRNNETKQLGELFNQGVVDFYDYPFENKFVAFSCPVCSLKQEFEIYECGQLLGSAHNSIKIKSSSRDGLTADKVSYVSALFKLNGLNYNPDKSKLQLKKCSCCDTDFVLCYYPEEYLSNEIVIKYNIQSLYRVQLSPHFIDSYVLSWFTSVFLLITISIRRYEAF